MAKRSQRVCFYIDGYNFYYGLKEINWKEYLWLDMVKLCKSLIKPEHKIISVNYFSAPPLNADSKKRRQKRFLDVNENNNLFKLHLSEHKPHNITCDACGEVIHTSTEKQTDVKIACELLSNCANRICDLSVLITGDSDLIPAIEAAKRIDSNHKVLIFFPPKRLNYTMKSIADGWRDLGLLHMRKKFQNSVFPDDVELVNGTHISIPEKWKLCQ